MWVCIGLNLRTAALSNDSVAGGDGFFMLPGSGSCYNFSSIALTWAQAKADCEAKGAMLFCPETESELTVVRNFVKTSECSLFQILFFYFMLHAQTWYGDIIYEKCV